MHTSFFVFVRLKNVLSRSRWLVFSTLPCRQLSPKNRCTMCHERQPRRGFSASCYPPSEEGFLVGGLAIEISDFDVSKFEKKHENLKLLSATLSGPRTRGHARALQSRQTPRVQHSSEASHKFVQLRYRELTRVASPRMHDVIGRVSHMHMRAAGAWHEKLKVQFLQNSFLSKG